MKTEQKQNRSLLGGSAAKGFAVNPAEWSLSPGTHTVEGKN